MPNAASFIPIFTTRPGHSRNHRVVILLKGHVWDSLLTLRAGNSLSHTCLEWLWTGRGAACPVCGRQVIGQVIRSEIRHRRRRRVTSGDPDLGEGGGEGTSDIDLRGLQ